MKNALQLIQGLIYHSARIVTLYLAVFYFTFFGVSDLIDE